MSAMKMQILIVEDTSADIFLIKFYLEELNPGVYEFSDVGTLAEAHKLLNTDKFDIILLDLHLPDSDGLITLTRTIDKFPDETYIVLTGLSDEKMGIEAVKNGAEDFLVKGRLDGKTLNNAIRFAHERTKLKKTLKLYGEGIKLLENHFKILVLFIDLKEKTVYHSDNINHYFTDEIKIENLNDLFSLTDEEALIEEKIKELNEFDYLKFDGHIKGKLFQICLQRNDKFNNEIILTIQSNI